MIRCRRVARTVTLATVSAAAVAGLVWLIAGGPAMSAALVHALLITGVLLTGPGLLDLLSFSPGLDRDGQPLELRDTVRLHRQLRRRVAWTADPAYPAGRGAALAQAIHGDQVTFCELDQLCGCTIAHLRNGDTITFGDFSDPMLRNTSHGHHYLRRRHR